MKIVILHNADALEPPVDPVIEQLSGALRSLDHEMETVVVDGEIDQLVDTLRRQAPDLIFNITESFRGKSALDSNIAALLNLIDYRYTGSSPAGLFLAGDKSLTKKVLRFHSIQTPEFATLYRGAVDWAGDLSFPVIVKPPQEDASLGITAASVVHEIKDLFARIDELQTEYQTPVLVEQFIEGREFYVAVLGNAKPEALPIIEMDFSGFPPDHPRIASWNAKWGEDGEGSGAEFAGTRSVFPNGLAEELVARMQGIAIEAFNALRLRDYARIDLRVTDSGEIYVIEVNPNCYLERESEFARMAEQHGLEYDALVARIVDLATARYAR
jgi:D-alanine-D-alanine ligase